MRRILVALVLVVAACQPGATAPHDGRTIDGVAIGPLVECQSQCDEMASVALGWLRERIAGRDVVSTAFHGPSTLTPDGQLANYGVAHTYVVFTPDDGAQLAYDFQCPGECTTMPNASD